ncbi:mannosyl transferase [Pontibacter korlensis]|uniref:Mannosyl transferase n=1 Tax=Pontibacter korlensis TaxID=400092 RepID=A0A0E3ZEW8_9BACT|nr:glycosyltransferase [Pontibacter korlensis]AKD03984.1 mannosyl transferase [Pontibacter korlensis]
MNIVFFSHPTFLGSQSMPRFTRMLAEGMKVYGHRVELWMPRALFYQLSVVRSMRKWLGYIDQYVLFPYEVRSRLKRCPPDTLFVFTDQALGPWVPMVAHRPHVIHCHDFLAQRAALGEIPENKTGWSGCQYQKFIRSGYAQGKHFISVSNKTKRELHALIPENPSLSEVVYNGLNQEFLPLESVSARVVLGNKIGVDLTKGYLLHVGGNQWYKNRNGVIEIYNAWRKTAASKLPLLMVGKEPDTNLCEAYALSSPYNIDIHFIRGLSDEYVRTAYAGASVFLFPSLAEGFGWPIAEAMASGCLVITTNEAPMTEVGANAAFYIPRRPTNISDVTAWATDAAKVVEKVISLSSCERNAVVKAGLENAKRFDQRMALERIEAIYLRILKTYNNL